MKKLIVLLVAIAGVANLSANGQGFCTGLVVEENFNNAFSCEAGVVYSCEVEMIDVPCPVFSVSFVPDTSPELTVAPVPEPSSLALCAIGVAGLTVARRSFRRKA
jgi:hypothetical protein